MSFLRITKNEKIFLVAALQLAFPNKVLSFKWMKENLKFNRKDESQITNEKEKLNANMLFTPEPSIEFEFAKKLLFTISLWQMIPLFFEKIGIPEAIFQLDFKKFSESQCKLPEILFTEKYESEDLLTQFTAWVKDLNGLGHDRKPIIFDLLQYSPQALQFIIKNGSKTDVYDPESGVAPLHVCVLKQRYDHIPIFKKLGCNMDVECRGKAHGQTPLYVACAISDYKMAKLLKKNGASKGLEYLDPGQNVTLTAKACIEGDAEALDTLLHLGALTTTLSKHKDTLYTPLQYAVLHQHRHLIPILKKYNANMNDGGDCRLTPLTLAIRDNHLEIARILLENGANINYYDKRQGILPLLAYGTASFAQARNTEDKKLILSKIDFTLTKGANPNLHFFDKHNNSFSTAFPNFMPLDEQGYQLAALLVNHGFDISEHDCEPFCPLSVVIALRNDKKLNEICGFSPSLKQNVETPAHTPTLFQPNNNDKLTLVNAIKANIDLAIASTTKHGLQNVPNWLTSLSSDLLIQQSINDLTFFDNQISEWTKATILRLSQPLDISSTIDTNDTTQTPTEPEEIIDAIYENVLPFDDKIMIEIRGTTNHYLLLPIGSDAQYGIDLITQNQKIDDAIIALFDRAISNPTLSTVPKQPGIKLLTTHLHTCSITINNQAFKKSIVGEIKVTESADRIGLCELSHSGHGPRLLAPICYIKKGLHTDGKRQFGADFALDLSPANMTAVKERIDLAYSSNTKQTKTTAVSKRISY